MQLFFYFFFNNFVIFSFAALYNYKKILPLCVARRQYLIIWLFMRIVVPLSVYSAAVTDMMVIELPVPKSKILTVAILSAGASGVSVKV